MSAYPPPIIISTIYNPTFFEASVDTITQGQANALYLKKKTPDTATALETFSAGISTTTAGITSSATVGTTLGVTGILTASSGVVTSNVNTGASTTLKLGETDTIERGCVNSRGSATVSIGTAGTGNVNISNAITNTVRLFSSTQGTNHQFDNINLIDTASGAMSLFNTQVGGALNIGTSATRTGAINIGKSGGTHLINIDTSSTSATAIQIGTSASAKTVKINNSTGSVHLSSLDIAGTGLNNVSNGTGNVSIGNLQTSGDISIGCSSGRLNTGGINIGNIGTGGFVIDIGHAASSTSLNGTTTIANLAIDAVNRASNGLLEIGTNAFNTSLNISRTLVTTAVLGLLTVAEATTLTGGLTIGGSNNIILSNGTVTPTVRQLGTTISSTNIFNGAITTLSGTMASLTIADAGKYLLTWMFTGSYTSFTAFSVALTGTNVTTGINFQTARDASTYSLSGSYVVQCTASTYTLSWYNVTTGFNNQSAVSFFHATRIG
jgi:hypothetical protein